MTDVHLHRTVDGHEAAPTRGVIAERTADGQTDRCALVSRRAA